MESGETPSSGTVVCQIRGKKCLAYGCGAYYCRQGIDNKYSFYRIPIEKERRIQWLNLVGRSDLALNAELGLSPKHIYICGRHFIGRPGTTGKPQPVTRLNTAVCTAVTDDSSVGGLIAEILNSCPSTAQHSTAEPERSSTTGTSSTTDTGRSSSTPASTVNNKVKTEPADSSNSPLSSDNLSSRGSSSHSLSSTQHSVARPTLAKLQTTNKGNATDLCAKKQEGYSTVKVSKKVKTEPADSSNSPLSSDNLSSRGSSSHSLSSTQHSVARPTLAKLQSTNKGVKLSEGKEFKKVLTTTTRSSNSVSTGDTSSKVAPSSVYNRGRMEKKVKLLEKRIKHLKDSRLDKTSALSALRDCLTDEGYAILESQVKLHGRQKRGYRWTPKVKNIALQIKQSSTKTYRLMKSIFKLPNTSTIARLLSNIDIEEGFHGAILKGLETWANNSRVRDKYVVLAFDEMQLLPRLEYNKKYDKLEGVDTHSKKAIPVTNYTGVFMIRGLASSFKQPIGYFLSCGAMSGARLGKLIKTAIQKVNDTGLHTVAFVMDNGTNNVSALNQLNIKNDTITVGDKDCFVFVDTPHLVKNTRTNLSKNGFIDSSNVKVSWTYLQKLEAYNSASFPRYCPKLTHQHIYLQAFKEMNVARAAQVLSNSVSVAMTMMIEQGRLPQAASNTAKFIQTFDRLFDVFNSSRIQNAKLLKRAIGKTSGHWPFLWETYQYIEQLKSQGRRATLPTMQGWLRNIRSLYKLVNSVDDMEFLLTRRISQDMLENLFSKIRDKGGKRETHTASQFRYAYRAACLDSLKYTIAGTNCSTEDEESGETLDTDKLFTTLLKITKPKQHTEKTGLDVLAELCSNAPKVPATTATNTADHNYPQHDNQQHQQELHTLFYMAGLFTKRGLQNLNCSECTDKILTDRIEWTESGDELAKFRLTKQYENVSKGLTYPSINSVRALQAMHQKQLQVLDYLLFTDNVISTLSRLMVSSVKDQIGCCQVHTSTLLKRMAINYGKLCLFEKLKEKNSQVKSESKARRQNRKYKKLASAQIRQPEQ